MRLGERGTFISKVPSCSNIQSIPSWIAILYPISYIINIAQHPLFPRFSFQDDHPLSFDLYA
ncbi:hypothetical protein Hanom_Chr00s119992g01811181 [Helianthus anomalus]